MERKNFAYIDESGNADLETQKAGASKYFIVCAILVSEQDKSVLAEEAEKVRKRYFQSGEMKSSSVGSNAQRRAKILNSLISLDFKFYALCINKERVLRDSGLQFKKSFLKYTSGKLYSVLFSSFLDVHVIADEHGGAEFKASFKGYIEENHKPDMFYRSEFDLVNSKGEILVQLADFLAGTLGKIYEQKISGELREAYIKLIESKALSIEEWPTKYQAYSPKDRTTKEFSELIYRYSLGKAEAFIEKNEKHHAEETRLQVATLRHLVFHSRMVEKQAYIATAAIIKYLQGLGFSEVTSYTIRSKIIAPLRDLDVIVTSSNKGYKIPCDFSDMEEFVERVNSIVTPLLNRLGKARKSLNIVSKGEVDILKGPDYPHLVTFIEMLEKSEKREI
ncbi:DUF3800 domain-containing protein [Thiosocius teredinicola]|uniref:DUF3800 domain-containing protein n=1 Tax=Thiosocius teredinicola TaxID=1973002 RepID=UPI000990B346